MRTLLFILLCCLLMAGAVTCRKDTIAFKQTGGDNPPVILTFKDPPPFDSCFEVPKPNNWLGDYDTVFSQDSVLYWPSTNPNNFDEFVCEYGSKKSLGNAYVCTYNIRTKARKVIFSDLVDISPKWSKKNWILLSYNDQLWKVRSDGSQLTQLTHKGDYNNYASWSPDGSKIAVLRVVGSDLFTLILDENGKELDTIKGLQYEGEPWSPDAKKLPLYTPSGGHGYYDLSTKSFVGLNLYIYAWFPDNKWIVVHGNSGLYRYNLETKEMVKFKSQCQNVGYDHLNISADGQKILFERTRRQGEGRNNLITSTRVGIMDLDGWNDHDIDF